MLALRRRGWIPSACEGYIQKLAQATHARGVAENTDRLKTLIERNTQIHTQECFNLNPATNVMNPRASKVLSMGLGERPSLGYPGDKYEMGLEAIEEIEVMAAELVAEVFAAPYVEIRVASGAQANLYTFMATCTPGDVIIVPPSTIAGHVTHHAAGCAGLYGLSVYSAPVNADDYTVDLEGLSDLAKKVKPKLISIGGSLNLFPHPIAQIREICDKVGAKLLFDAAHQCGMVASHMWPDPLAEGSHGAHVMTMSTYKSLGGPAGGLLLTHDPEIAQALDAIAFPGMTANFDIGKSAALLLTMLDWKVHGEAYGRAMVDTAQALANALMALDIPVFACARGGTQSHQFAVEAAPFGGGQCAAKILRKAGFLSSGIGLPIAEVQGDANGLRIGTPEIVRWGMMPSDMKRLGALMAKSLRSPEEAEAVAHEVSQWRSTFNKLHYMIGDH